MSYCDSTSVRDLFARLSLLPALCVCFLHLAFAEAVGAQTQVTPNTMRLVEGEEPPPAKIQDVAWLAGSWIGQAMGGTFEETWHPPSGDSMVGLFKLVRNGQTQFSEIMTIVPQGESIILKIKHFHADLRGWEEKDQSLDFPLVKLSENEACFRGLTFRKKSADEMTIYLAMKRDAGSVEIEFPAHRASATTSLSKQSSDPSPSEPAQSSQASSELEENLLEEIDTYVQKVQRDWDVPGLAVAIVKDGKTLFTRGYGVRKLGTDDKVDGDTQFAIASNSKAFTAAALAILVDEGKLQWDDPVTKHLPTFQMPDAWVTREMTVRDLLCHRSGMDTFSGDLLWYDTTYTTDEIIDRIRFLKPVSSFRSRYGYQNLMYIVAGKVIERVSGLNWADFVRTKILEPCGMHRTTTSVSQLSSNFALPHNRSGGDNMRSLPLGNVDNSWGACGLNSSVNDLALWIQMQMEEGQLNGRRVLSAQRLYELWQPNTIVPLSQAALSADTARNFQTYGLGYVLHDWHGRKIVGHSGGLDGMISQLAMVPSEKLGVVILTNSESSASRFIRDRVLECFLGVQERRDRSAEAVSRLADADQRSARQRDEQDAARRSNAPTTIPLAELTGTFHSPLYGDVTVSFEDERLVLSLVPAPNFIADLEHWHFNTFQIHWRDTVKYDFPRGFVNFTIDEAGRPKQLIIDQPNDDFWFYELELFRKD